MSPFVLLELVGPAIALHVVGDAARGLPGPLRRLARTCAGWSRPASAASTLAGRQQVLDPEVAGAARRRRHPSDRGAGPGPGAGRAGRGDRADAGRGRRRRAAGHRPVHDHSAPAGRSTSAGSRRTWTGPASRRRSRARGSAPYDLRRRRPSQLAQSAGSGSFSQLSPPGRRRVVRAGVTPARTAVGGRGVGPGGVLPRVARRSLRLGTRPRLWPDAGPGVSGRGDPVAGRRWFVPAGVRCVTEAHPRTPRAGHQGDPRAGRRTGAAGCRTHPWAQPRSRQAAGRG